MDDDEGSRRDKARARRLAGFTCTLLMLTVWRGAAFGDIAPPPGYVETCTLEKQATPAYECHECRSHFSNPARCGDVLQGYGFVQRCRTRGATVWGEVWCRHIVPAPAPVPSQVLDQLSRPDVRIKSPLAD